MDPCSLIPVTIGISSYANVSLNELTAPRSSDSFLIIPSLELSVSLKSIFAVVGSG